MFQKKMWLSVLGTIVLGAIGSALWSFLEVPLGKFGNWFLSLATFGIGSIRDGLYADAAKGLHEQPSLILFLVISTFIFMVPVMIAVTPILISRLRKIADVGSVTDVGQVANDKNRLIELEKRLNKTDKLLWINALIGIACGSFFLIQAMFAAEQNLIATSFLQRLKIVAPYLSTTQVVLYESKFSRMQSRAEYKELMLELEEIGKTNNVNLPNVSSW